MRLIPGWQGVTGGQQEATRTDLPLVKVSLTLWRRTGVGKTGSREAAEEGWTSLRERRWWPQLEEGRGTERGGGAERSAGDRMDTLRDLISLWKVTEIKKSSRAPCFKHGFVKNGTISFGWRLRNEV